MRLRFADCRIWVAVVSSVLLSACQTASFPPLLPAMSYSGYFYWEAERPLGLEALQCLQVIFEDTKELPDGKMKLVGVTRYVTGPAAAVDFVDAEMIFDPEAQTFEMWERNATSNTFVADGRFTGRFHTGVLFATGKWVHDGRDGDYGFLSLRQGTDAPCQYDGEA